MIKSAEQIIVDIIAQEMEIDPAKNIWVRDQNRKIPANDELYIVVGMVDSVPISSKTHMIERVTPQPDPDPDLVQQVEINEAQLKENIQIDVLSKSDLARSRRWEVIAALRSILSQQRQEENSFKIFRLPQSFVNASIAEGGSQLNRFSMSFSCFVWYRKEKILTPDGGDYYDDFTTRVDDAETIGEDDGIFEFKITAED